MALFGGIPRWMIPFSVAIVAKKVFTCVETGSERRASQVAQEE